MARCPALERLPFSGFQSSLIADRRGSAIRPAIETLQKANRSCGRARMATSTVDHGFTGYLPTAKHKVNNYKHYRSIRESRPGISA
ncbi:MAG: hypothetical protein JRI35_05040 [Deltaproteobacteria bacterium]|nr:hypothetical protein [Deltaproteobacteria bacterium]